MSISNAVTWISTIPAPSQNGTSLGINPKVDVKRYGDGYIARVPVGINNVSQTYTLSYEYLDFTQHYALMEFVYPLLGSGRAVYVPNYFKNASGSVSEYFYVVSATPSAQDALFNWTIELQQIFA